MTIRKLVNVSCGPDKAFRVFTSEIGRWWPLKRGFSTARERANEIFLDDHVGGRFYERFTDGSECEIGRVIRCEPPHLIVFTFKTPAWDTTTEVEVRFAAVAGGTRIDLEHRGFETSPTMRERGKGFASGWDIVLAQFAENATREQRRKTMKLYHFPSPNPQKVTFALKELGLNCELIPVDLAKGEQRQPAFLAVNPAGRVPVLVDDGTTLSESHAILAYLGETTGRMWPVSAAERAQALQWLFFLSQHIMPAAGEVALRIRAKVTGVAADEIVVARGEAALKTILPIIEDRLQRNKWMLGSDFSLADCAYCPIFNVIERAGFSLAGFPKISAYLDTSRSRAAWKETPKLPGL